MKIKISFIIFIIYFSNYFIFAQAEELPPVAVVTKLKGTVLFNGALVSSGDSINKIGKLVTKDKSYILLKIEKWKNTISIGPNSEMILNFSDEKKYTLESGICRWKSFANSESKGKIFTKRVALGVRGTDFLLTSNYLLNETEVIMFDGEVLMENNLDKTNTAVIKKGQWGGVGGRFGEKISPILDLPKEVIASAQKSLE